MFLTVIGFFFLVLLGAGMICSGGVIWYLVNRVGTSGKFYAVLQFAVGAVLLALAFYISPFHVVM